MRLLPALINVSPAPTKILGKRSEKKANERERKRRVILVENTSEGRKKTPTFLTKKICIFFHLPLLGANASKNDLAHKMKYLCGVFLYPTRQISIKLRVKTGLVTLALLTIFKVLRIFWKQMWEWESKSFCSFCSIRQNYTWFNVKSGLPNLVQPNRVIWSAFPPHTTPGKTVFWDYFLRGEKKFPSLQGMEKNMSHLRSKIGKGKSGTEKRTPSFSEFFRQKMKKNLAGRTVIIVMSIYDGHRRPGL